MPVPATDAIRWNARIARARDLSSAQPAAADILAFYARLAGFQRDLLARLRASGGATAPPAEPFAEALDLHRLAPEAGDLAGWMRREGPAPLADAAAELAARPPAFWLHLLREYCGALGHGLPAIPDAAVCLAESVLQPAAEALALARVPPVSGPDRQFCPVCSGLPVAGLLREEAYGARRSLVCGLCLTEWGFPRTRCAACGEERFDALAVYTAEQLPHVRVEACETCRVYVKSVDLTKDGRADPLVDELASVALDLWAAGKGYHKLRPNLLRL